MKYSSSLLFIAILASAPEAVLASAAKPFEPSLFRSRMRLEPALAQLNNLPRFAAEWHLVPGVAGNLAGVLRSRGFSAGITGELVARLRLQANGSGLLVPDSALLDRFSSQERDYWAEVLALDRRNVTYRWPLAIPETVLDEMGREPGMTEAVRRVRRWSVPSAGRLLFRDCFALEDAFSDAETRLRFFQRATGSDAWLVKLEVTGTPAEKDAAAAYWHTHGHYRAIRPFLTALDAITGHDRVDVVHLLPPVGRRLLNSYPAGFLREIDPAPSSAAAAAQFFVNVSEVNGDVREGFARWLERECIPIVDEPRYGDILVYDDPAKEAWPYSVVYIADGIVFGRRPTAFGPWQLLERAEISLLNPRLPRTPRIYRSKLLSEPYEPAQTASAGRSPDVFLDGLELSRVETGPWGRLYYYKVLLAPSYTLLDSLPAPSKDPIWSFRGLAPMSIIEGIRTIDMPSETRAGLLRLFEQARPGPDGLLTVRPTQELVMSTPAAFRDAFFPRLEFPKVTSSYLSEIKIPTAAKVEDWFSREMLPVAARQDFHRLVYHVDGRLRLAEYGSIFHMTGDAAERRVLQRAIFRTPGLIVLLAKPLPEDVPGLAAYWQSGRLENVGPILESFATSSDTRFLDIMHLLPTLPRQLMNMFSGVADGSPMPNCAWTSLNFSALVPDNRFLLAPDGSTDQAIAAWQELRANYESIPAPSRLGDIIVYHRRDEPSRITHMSVQIAGNIVFTKNGFGVTEPWCLSTREDMEALFDTSDIVKAYFRAKPAR